MGLGYFVFILKITLPDRNYYYVVPHFTDKETDKELLILLLNYDKEFKETK